MLFSRIRGLFRNPGVASTCARYQSTYVEGGQTFMLIDKRPKLFREKPLTFLKVLVVTLGGIYSGAIAAKKMANFLEDNDIFAPDDDDDDD